MRARGKRGILLFLGVCLRCKCRFDCCSSHLKCTQIQPGNRHAYEIWWRTLNKFCYPYVFKERMFSLCCGCLWKCILGLLQTMTRQWISTNFLIMKNTHAPTSNMDIASTFAYVFEFLIQILCSLWKRLCWYKIRATFFCF